MTPPLFIQLDAEETFSWFGGQLRDGGLSVGDSAQWAAVTEHWAPGDPVVLVALDGSTLPGVIIGLDHTDQKIEVLA